MSILQKIKKFFSKKQYRQPELGIMLQLDLPQTMHAVNTTFDKFQKMTPDCKRHVEVLVSALGETKEMTLRDLLTKLEFDVK